MSGSVFKQCVNAARLGWALSARSMKSGEYSKLSQAHKERRQGAVPYKQTDDMSSRRIWITRARLCLSACCHPVLLASPPFISFPLSTMTTLGGIVEEPCVMVWFLCSLHRLTPIRTLAEQADVTIQDTRETEIRFNGTA